MDNIVRIQKIEINNLKNVGKGSIQFAGNTTADDFAKKADILGVYGQNGSGKTALIYAISIFKTLLMGNRLGKDCVNYIKYGTESSICKFELKIADCNLQYFKVIYQFEIKRKEDRTNNKISFEAEEDEIEEKENQVYISMEKLSMSRFEKGKWTKLIPVLYFNEKNSNVLAPGNRYAQILSGNQQIEDELRVTRLLVRKTSRSFLFSKELNAIIKESQMDNELKNIFSILHDYAIYNLHVISNAEAGIINANIALPFSFVFKQKNKVSLLKGSLNLNDVSNIPQKFFEQIETKIDMISMVLKEIIPGLVIHLKSLGSVFDKNGEEVIRAEIIAVRGTTELPLKYESDGIKKLVSILYCLILMFNSSSTTLAVDELDSGIFEYLLGEILKIVEENGKGQLIFTSHNLRALEVLSKKNIMFTTTNEDNRYIRLKNVKTNNNLRDLYFHDIILGGQNECIYEATNPYMICRAFRLAGDESDI